jgi:glycosyltransferase involved in cell wall biosynthesis
MPPLTSHPNSSCSFSDLSERCEDGLVILNATGGPRHGRRVLFVNSYGGASVWQKIKQGLLPPHHLWGCIELARLGYEVLLAPPLAHFDFRKPFPHDVPLLSIGRKWLRRDDILYCGHTLLYWLPLMKALGLFRCPIVSLTYAREQLDFSRTHTGIIALTAAAEDEAKKRAPKAKIARLAWGCDLQYFPTLDYAPRWFLSCGITHRDLATLSAAAGRTPWPIRLISPGTPKILPLPRNVTLIDGGTGWNYQKSVVSYDDLFYNHYAGAIASLIILKHDPAEKTAVGFTNLLEAMAMSRAVIVTRTGAVPTEIDVEAAGCGLHVPPENPAALAGAIETLAADPETARRMGSAGRRLAEDYYNIGRYARELHAFFESL